MKRKLLVLLIVLASLAGSVVATPVSLTWYWDFDDFDVAFFRYQLDGEEEGKWTETDSFTTDVTFDNIDGDTDHTLYLQQSYDGITWSPSAVSSYSLLFAPKQAEEDDWAVDVFDVESTETIEPVEETIPEVEEEKTPEIAEIVAVVPEEVEKPDNQAVLVSLFYRSSLYHTLINKVFTGGKISYIYTFDVPDKNFSFGGRADLSVGDGNLLFDPDSGRYISLDTYGFIGFSYYSTRLLFQTGVEYVLNTINPVKSSFGFSNGFSVQIGITDSLFGEAGISGCMMLGDNPETGVHSGEIRLAAGYRF